MAERESGEVVPPLGQPAEERPAGTGRDGVRDDVLVERDAPRRPRHEHHQCAQRERHRGPTTSAAAQGLDREPRQQDRGRDQPFEPGHHHGRDQHARDDRAVDHDGETRQQQKQHEQRGLQPGVPVGTERARAGGERGGGDSDGRYPLPVRTGAPHDAARQQVRGEHTAERGQHAEDLPTGNDAVLPDDPCEEREQHRPEEARVALDVLARVVHRPVPCGEVVGVAEGDEGFPQQGPVERLVGQGEREREPERDGPPPASGVQAGPAHDHEPGEDEPRPDRDRDHQYSTPLTRAADRRRSNLPAHPRESTPQARESTPQIRESAPQARESALAATSTRGGPARRDLTRGMPQTADADSRAYGGDSRA